MKFLVRFIFVLFVWLPSTPVQSAPNIVVFYLDDMAFDLLQDIGRMQGHATFGSLVKSGASFLNSYVTMSLCGPSRASLMTGQYPHNHGIWGNDLTPHGYVGFSESETLPVWLSRAGYHTALVGKYINGYGYPDTHPLPYIPPGWTYWATFSGMPNYYDYTLNINGNIETRGNTSADYSTDVLAGFAGSFLSAQDDATPFFLLLSLNAPHAPFTPPIRYANLFGGLTAPRTTGYSESDMGDKPAFMQVFPLLGSVTAGDVRGWIDWAYVSQLNALQAVDDAIASVIKILSAKGMMENTYLILTSDNGWMRGQHRVPHGKIYAYEPSSRVPLVIVGPGVLAERTRAELVLNIDLTATILDWAGAAAGRVIDGASLRSMLASTINADVRTALLSESPMDQEVGYINGWGPDTTIPSYSMLRTSNPPTKLITYGTGETELYDLNADPNEVSNLHANLSWATTLAMYQQIVARMKTCVGLQCLGR